MKIKLSNCDARRIILHLQGLSRSPHTALGRVGLYELIEQLGFVQVDSIQWVERAQHMTLFSRDQAYRPTHLQKLLEKEQLLFENWTHDASVIPSAFFQYWRHKFDRDRPKLDVKFTKWFGDGHLDHCAALQKRIEQEGALRSRDLEKSKPAKKEMWAWHDEKAALEYLWRTGALCIRAREGFQKVYDVTHRGIRPEHFEQHVSRQEFIDWACRSALDRLGFGTASDIARYWDLLSIAEVREWLNNQDETSTRLVTVTGVKGQGDRELIARSDIESILDEVPKLPKRVRALSPFDPVIRDRKRLSWLFGFDYRIEIYVPEEKRKWGYYVFPLLEGDRLIGRIDMRARRKENQLEVKKLWLEPKVKLSTARKNRIDAELIRQARLAGVEEVVWLDEALDSVLVS